MTFQFESLADFFTMSGHGFFVWFCYGITFIAIAWLIVSPLRAERRFMKDQQRLARLQHSQAARSAPAEVN